MRPFLTEQNTPHCRTYDAVYVLSFASMNARETDGAVFPMCLVSVVACVGLCVCGAVCTSTTQNSETKQNE